MSEKRRALFGLRPGERQRTAEALYKAANSDADTFQAALLIPEVRKKIEAALGRAPSDKQLRALVDSNRTEAVYWYGYAQRLGASRMGQPRNNRKARTAFTGAGGDFSASCSKRWIARRSVGLTGWPLRREKNSPPGEISTLSGK